MIQKIIFILIIAGVTGSIFFITKRQETPAPIIQPTSDKPLSPPTAQPPVEPQVNTPTHPLAEPSPKPAPAPSPSIPKTPPPPQPSPLPKPPSPQPVPPAPQLPTVIDVKIKNFSFSPVEIRVKTGTIVHWTQEDFVGHTVTADNGEFRSSVLNQGKIFEHAFTNKGTFTYHCEPHPSMVGAVIVE